MALFKEIHCVHCGEKTGMMNRTKLTDGNYVCTKCAKKLPIMLKAELHQYSYTEFRKLCDYVQEMETVLRKQFHATYSFYGIHIDTEHGLFKVDDFDRAVILKFENLSDFTLDYQPDEVKDGVFSTKVTGKLYYKMKMNFPYVFRDGVLAERVKSSAQIKEGLFKKKAIYSNPAGMDEFIYHFNQIWNQEVNAMYDPLTR